ncbi:hypothetical protein [Actinoplanes couchii]|uniref:Uncharacterized protein n=1 Tax=Actinoplanes couchii TaxID=403638 RepID=A0ABQ3XLU5_9ACTN|nr:hypothetical protein [Actinoplanes couchii]MDR6318259.1 hypothetical protein [Actinoplanes couchii]GID59370.1 hypothetical protein Aco03nite_077740 [Actinoplanes couchii]
MNSDVLLELRAARRAPGPGRREALTALANLGGWDALDPVDQRAMARLIEVKALTEKPGPMHLCGSWYAVPAAVGRQAVLDAFELADARPVTMRLGASAWNNDRHNWDLGDHGACSRMYITPALDGWTLVFGTVPTVAHLQSEAAFREAVRAHCAELSGRFGVTQWYGASCGDGWTAWCLAEDGRVTDRYDILEPEPPENDHEPVIRYYDDLVARTAPPTTTRFEQLHIEGFGAPTIVRRNRSLRGDERHATEVAAGLSINPAALGPHHTVTGRALLALTSCGIGRPSTPGALAC